MFSANVFGLHLVPAYLFAAECVLITAIVAIENQLKVFQTSFLKEVESA